jgi:sRNA-binding regulator protein Hfq
LAHALGDAGFAIYPQDEEILTINAFLSMMKQNWDQLSEYLVPLIRIRGDRTQSNEFVVLSESFQKRMEYKVAIEIAAQGLIHYPDNEKLKAIHQELIAMMSFVGGERFSQ